jgi:hypothetical protein
LRKIDERTKINDENTHFELQSKFRYLCETKPLNMAKQAQAHQTKRTLAQKIADLQARHDGKDNKTTVYLANEKLLDRFGGPSIVRLNMGPKSDPRRVETFQARGFRVLSAAELRPAVEPKEAKRVEDVPAKPRGRKSEETEKQ